MATDRMLDGWEETRFGGFFVACKKVPGHNESLINRLAPAFLGVALT